jgi:hypothetical protein
LCTPQSPFPVAVALHSQSGARLGDLFSFLSGLYFRGKLAYARAFEHAPRAVHGTYVITPSRGLMSPDARVNLELFRKFSDVPIDVQVAAYREPLEQDIQRLARKLPRRSEVVLLGSVASNKYIEVLASVLGERLVFPVDFVGRGDMSRGGLLLRHAADGVELDYAPVVSSDRRGARPAKLKPRPGLQKLLRR